MRNTCFICNIGRETFERNSDGFERHIEKDHNLWQYVYFIMHLQNKDSTEHTGIESYVMDRYLNDDISWLPIMHAMCIDKVI